jgi:DNA-binding NarL/FixJ family response regulator
VNARDVLTPETLEAVVTALDGKSGYMWVPARRNVNRKNRNQYVVRLFGEGHSAADIAGRLFISERTVWRILAVERNRGKGARRAPSDPAAGRGRQ